MGDNYPGSAEYRRNERAAQERHNVPIDTAGRDYISRETIDWNKYRDNFDNIFRTENKKELGQVCPDVKPVETKAPGSWQQE